MKQVKKRNGQVVDFEVGKITEAMRKAFESEYVPISKEKLEEMTSAVADELSARFNEQTPSVENVQDLVEFTLMREGYLSIAKHYIVYRYEHAKIRAEKKQEVIQKVEEKRLTIKTASGREEAFDEEKVRANLMKFVKGYEDAIDVDGVMTQVKYELFEGMTTDEVRRALIMVVRSMIERDPAYSKVAAKLHLHRLYGEVFGHTFKESELLDEHARLFAKNIKMAVENQNLDPRMMEFDLDKMARAMKLENDSLFEYMGLEIMSSRYCMEDPKTKKPLETPQMLWMRIAMGLSLNELPADRERVAMEFYDLLSNFYYTPGGRTLFQSGALKAQLSNCFLNTVPDSLDAIFKSFSDNAQYLKWSGGTGTDWTPVRSTGSFIKGTGVGSQGIVPFLKIANDVNIAINRSGKRRGAGCVYLETWHLDIEDFLELRNNTGD